MIATDQPPRAGRRRAAHCLTVAAAALLLGACAGHQPNTLLHTRTDTAAVERFWSGVRTSNSLAMVHYKLGRYYQKGAKHRLALEAFRKALEIDETFVLAYNGVGVSLDALKDCAGAEKAYSKALQYMPDLAYLHNNLGCSRLLCNDPAQALAHLTRAAELDAATTRIQNNLRLARLRLQRQTQADRVATGQVESRGAGEAPALLPTVPPERAAMATAGAQHPSPGREASPAVSNWVGAGRDEVSATALSIKTRQEQPAAKKPEAGTTIPEDKSPATAAKQVPTVDGKQDQAGAVEARQQNAFSGAVEISNGNGVTGMARRSATFLRNEGFTISRITNAANFNFAESRIFYQQGYAELARSLAEALPGAQDIEPETRPSRRGIGVRVVLGKDVAAVDFPAALARSEEAQRSSLHLEPLVVHASR